MGRETFVRKLKELENNILTLGSRVDSALTDSIECLKFRDKELAKKIIEGDDEIDALSASIELEAATILATQQPTGEDLRFILSILFMNIDLERVADHAVDIAEVAIDIADEPLLKPLIDIPRMKETCSEMLREAMEAFIKKDVEMAYSMIKKDDLLDILYNQIFRELLTYMLEDAKNIRRANALLMVSQHLERVGDHATNMGERVIYFVTGDFLKINPHKPKY